MRKIVITEFMDAPAVEKLAARFDVDYRPKLVDDAAALEQAVHRRLVHELADDDAGPHAGESIWPATRRAR